MFVCECPSFDAAAIDPRAPQLALVADVLLSSPSSASPAVDDAPLSVDRRQNADAATAAAVAPNSLMRFWRHIPTTTTTTFDGYSLVAECIGALDSGVSCVIVDLVTTTADTDFATALKALPSDRVILRMQHSAAAAAAAAGTDATAALLALLAQFSPLVAAFIISIDFASDVFEENQDSDAASSSPRKLFERQQALSLLSQITAVVGSPKSGGRRRLIVSLPKVAPSYSVISMLDKLGVDILLRADDFAFHDDNSPGKLDIGEAYASCLVTDRADGLYPTVVVDEQRVALGLAYSSVKSISETIRTGQGVYQSRSRGLWYKGLSSGATQSIKRIMADCDKDTLQFVVDQKDPGYCHLNTRTCFGNDWGLTALSHLLRSRMVSSPPGSYTRRLFDDSTLLHSKIMEEANELCEATTPEDIAWEAADLMYFAMVKCAAAGVSLNDIERQLDRRAKKVSRRPGDAKPQWEAQQKAKEAAAAAAGATAPSNKDAEPAGSETIKMKHYRLSDFLATTDASVSSGPDAPQSYQTLLRRPVIKSSEIMAKVRPIVDEVRARGDKAVLDLTAKFDKVILETPTLVAPFDKSLMAISDDVKAAIDTAFDNIRTFHAAQLVPELRVETMPGVVCTRFARPIGRVGLYVPGGTAVLPSTALMLGVPAMVAGCPEIVFASPPRKDGTPVPEMMYVAHKVGAKAVVLAGGAQAVAAMAFGTETVPKVDKVCGPGNQFVTAAKMMLQNDASAMISIDMPAGPSELLVIADNTSVPAYVASDLLSQAEHGVDSQVVLVGVALTSAHLAAIESEIASQAARLPRVDIVRKSIAESFFLHVDDLPQAVRFSNDYAPEHLILHLDAAQDVVKDVFNAGSVFVGPWSPESCGDYASGTNHTLPTYGYARMYSGVNTDTFLKHITTQTLTKDGLNGIGDTVTTLAEIEGLEAHRNAVAIRLRDIRSQ